MTSSPSRARVAAHLRALGTLAAMAAAAYGLYSFQVTGYETIGWQMLGVALVLAALAQLGIEYPTPAPAPPPEPSSIGRRVIGTLLALAGAALWGLAVLRLHSNWQVYFDFAWLSWVGAATLMSIGLDFAWARWPRPAQRRWPWAVVGLMLALLAVAAWYRLGNIRDFPGEAAITQIEDLQVGNFGWAYLNGYRLRWEYLSSTWLAALGIGLGGPSQFAMRVPFAAVSALKVLAVFVWLRLMVGTTGAAVGSALLAFSFWDVVLSRIPNNHNALIVAIAFALLAGPARRGRPSAYVWLGFLGGYILHEYIAYRPLAVFAVAGAVLYSLTDRDAGWAKRLARPLLTVALLLTMVAPLFLGRIAGPMRIEYFDGWNRARGISGYYNPTDTWAAALSRRFSRAYDAAELFTVRGDRSPVRNVGGQPPLIDPVTCALMVVGMGAALAHLLRPALGLTLLGCLVTVAGTLVMTGNFDVARVGGAVPYVYALAGIGAAAVMAAVAQAWGRFGRVLVALGLALAVVGAGEWCTRHLFELWSNASVRRSHRNNLAYLTVWLRDHTHKGERVLGIAPGYANVLEGHDGSWLRGRDVTGFVTWDVETALRQWASEPGPTLLFIYAGESTEAEANFLESLLPGLHFEIDVDPLAAGGDVAYARLPGPPPDLAERLAEWHCRGIHAEFSLVGERPGDILFAKQVVAPFICKSTWPAEVVQKLYYLTVRPTRTHIRYASPFTIRTAGPYRFELQTYAGSGTLKIDGNPRDSSGNTAVDLTPGLHELEIVADFAPMAVEPVIRLLWSGPDTAQRQELMPFYKLAPVDPSCAAAAGQTPFASGSAGGTAAARRYLTAWLGRGPFDGVDDGAVRRDYIDVPSLSAAPRPNAAAEWKPIAPRDAFVDLDQAFPLPPDENRWVCAYAATTIRSPSQRQAFLELAGSGDPVRAWLNGRELSNGPLTPGYEPRRRPVALREGENLIVIESCELLGAWYFIAALTDEQGVDLSDIEAVAALPRAPIPLPPVEKALDVALVEGFGEIVTAPHTQTAYGDYRGGTQSWWTYAEDDQPEVVWRTAPLAEAKRTVVAITASTSPENGDAELIVNGRSVLAFPIGTQGLNGTWEGDGFHAAFVSKGFFEGNSGLFLVSVPPEAVTPGKPLDLRVRVTGGAQRAWFMIKGYPDSIAFEKLSGPETQELMHGSWESVKRD